VAVGQAAGTRPNKRETILEAVSHAIARRGVRGMRVEEVAADAGVSVALLYYHFGSRLGLVAAALGYAHDRAPSTGALSDPPAGTMAFEALEAALLAELDDARAVREFSVVWGEVAASAVFESELRPEVRRVCASWSADVERTIRAGIDAGSIRGDVDPAAAAQLLTTLVDGLCARWLAGVMEREQARDLLRVALRGSLRPDEPEQSGA
jgi:AcrR family transcriptional regulator